MRLCFVIAWVGSGQLKFHRVRTAKFALPIAFTGLQRREQRATSFDRSRQNIYVVSFGGNNFMKRIKSFNSPWMSDCNLTHLSLYICRWIKLVSEFYSSKMTFTFVSLLWCENYNGHMCSTGNEMWIRAFVNSCGTVVRDYNEHYLSRLSTVINQNVINLL